MFALRALILAVVVLFFVGRLSVVDAVPSGVARVKRGGCSDRAQNCASSAGLCEDAKYAKTLAYNCAATCKKC